MARSKADLATDALRLLKVVASDENPSAADASDAEGTYDDLRSELIDKGLAYWPSTTRTTAEIPAVVFRALAMILAARLAPKYGMEAPMTHDDDGKQVPMVAKGFRDLRRHMAKPASGVATPATYF